MPSSMRRTTIEGIFDGPGERSTCFRPTRKFCLWSGVYFASMEVIQRTHSEARKRTSVHLRVGSDLGGMRSVCFLAAAGCKRPFVQGNSDILYLGGMLLLRWMVVKFP